MDGEQRGLAKHFTRKDAIAEVVHDLMAFNQWGSTIYKIMLKLAVETGDGYPIVVQKDYGRSLRRRFGRRIHAA